MAKLQELKSRRDELLAVARAIADTGAAAEPSNVIVEA